MVVQIYLPLLNHQSLEHIENISIDKTGFMTHWLSFELVGHRQNRLAIDRTEWLSIEKIGNQLNRRATDKA